MTISDSEFVSALTRLGQRTDRHFLARPDVEDLADRPGMIHQRHQGSDDVADVGEAARLVAVAVDRDRPAGERLLDERRHDHAVLPGLARSDGVEQPDDHRRELALAPVGQRQELVDRLRAGVAPPPLGRRTQHQVAVLAERDLLAQPVDLRGRGDQDLLLLLVGLGQHDLGAVDVGLDRPDRALDDQPDADRRGQVEDHIALVDQLGDRRAVVDALDRVMEPRMRLEMADVVDAARREVVEDEDLVAARQVSLGRCDPMKPAPPVISTRMETLPQPATRLRRTESRPGS